MSDKTIVLFRAERSGPNKGDVTAVFPLDIADDSGHVTCYAHIGQHAACGTEWYYSTRPATVTEYADLAAELTSIGYDLEIRKRWPARRFWLTPKGNRAKQDKSGFVLRSLTQ